LQAPAEDAFGATRTGRLSNLTPGQRLGPYEIVSLIGAGGMGQVYEARDTRLGRTVAIKVLPPHVAGDPERLQRFEREARTISRLSHPHICALYDIGDQGGIRFLVMEHLLGETLAARLEKGRLPIDEAVEYGVAIAKALDEAHRHGVIHRDLKPANVVLTRSGPKLVDFGIAKLHREAPETTGTGTLTERGVVVGTPQSMAPDQHLWAENFDRDFRDVLAIQSDVARAVARQVRAKLTPQEQGRLAAATPQVDPRAYELYLRSRQEYNMRTRASLDLGIEHLKQAIQIEPRFAAAHATLAVAFLERDIWGGLGVGHSVAEARAAAERALELDSSAAEAYLAQSIIRFQSDWDWDGALASLARALELNPNLEAGEHDRALSILERAARERTILPFAFRDWPYDALRTLPRFQALLRSVKLEP
jgi:tRNA A-37 threonylcarbamoyl transferase component Bud32